MFVFISCDSEEFPGLRDRLQKAIDSEYMYNVMRTDERDELVHQGVIMKAVVVERESDESFDLAMKKGIEKSQIYVGIFGKDYSIPTQKEYHAARQRGLPILVYYYTQPPHIAKGFHTKVTRFLEKDVKPELRIRGNYGRIEAHDDMELVDLILNDLACKTVDLAREAMSFRRMLLEKAPDDVIAAILRAKKSVFE